MASELKPDGFFMFDQQESDQCRHARNGRVCCSACGCLSSSRYALLTIVFLLAGSMIFYNTAVLQFNPVGGGRSQ